MRCENCKREVKPQEIAYLIRDSEDNDTYIYRILRCPICSSVLAREKRALAKDAYEALKTLEKCKVELRNTLAALASVQKFLLRRRTDLFERLGYDMYTFLNREVLETMRTLISTLEKIEEELRKTIM